MKRLILSLVLCVVFNSQAANNGTDTVTVLKPENISSDPSADSKSTATLERGEKVEILDRQGGWIKVTARHVTGWLRYLSVTRGELSKSSGDVGGVLSLATGQAGTGQITAVAGIRGLSEEQLKAAKFNGTEFKKLESYTVTSDVGKQFAEAGALQSRTLDYPPPPPAPAPTQQQGIQR